METNDTDKAIAVIKNGIRRIDKGETVSSREDGEQKDTAKQYPSPVKNKKGVTYMSDRELCTQYELIIALLEDGKTDNVFEILENAIKRIENNS